MVVLARDEADKESSSNAQQACDFMAISIKKNLYYCFYTVDKYAFCHAGQAFSSLGWALVAGRQRHVDRQCRALARLAVDLHLAAQCLHPFAYAFQAEGAALAIVVGPHADAVVADAQVEMSMLLRQRYVHYTGLRMAHDVGQRFLQHAKDGRGLALIQAQR